MQYEFDGYSEASSSSNSPGRAAAANTRNQGTGAGQDQSRGERRAEDADGFYRGTGRFERENRGYETRDRRHRQQHQQHHHYHQQQHQQQQRPRYTSPYQAAFFEYVGSEGPMRSEEEWSRIFMEAFRRTAEERRGGGGGGGASTNGAGAGLGGYAGYGGGTYEDEDDDDDGYARDGFEQGRGTGYDEFLGGLFGAAGAWYQGGGFQGGGLGLGLGSEHRETPRGGSFGRGAAAAAGPPGVRFEEVFGAPPSGGGGGGGGRDDAGPRRGGAGMTREEFDDLFRARFAGPSATGYGRGGPPADLFDRWHSDW